MKLLVRKIDSLNHARIRSESCLTPLLAPGYTRYAMTSRFVLALRWQLFVFLLLLGAALPVFAQVPAGDIRIHYNRPDGNYSGWGLYAWNAATARSEERRVGKECVP